MLDAPALPRTVAIEGPSIVASLADWFATQRRVFPWRTDAALAAERIERGEPVNDPYVVLLSEVMLQQTQTTRVTALLPEFLARFPDVASLAAASRGDVLRAWQGLGYNNRAVRLHEAAAAIVSQHGGSFPRTVEELRALPGIGPYTAAAVACFAFGAAVAVVDVNIQRVLSRLFFRCPTVEARMSEDAVRRVDRALIPERGAYWWHQALMDLGATICTARRPACDRCPLVAHCLSAHPRDLGLFGTATTEEPMIASAPRRIWRGRIVELLRSSDGGLSVASLIEQLPGAGALDREERERLRAVVDMLVGEGMLVAESTVTRDGTLVAPETVVRLPA